jgi:hypothetical protein
LKEFKKNQQIPVARKDDIVVQELPGETLVYDLRQHKAHCLNQTAALVWSHCDGETDVVSIAALLSKELHRAIDEDVVWLALKQLQKSGLLEREIVAPGAKPNVSRREVVRRLGAATALALPLVTSVVAPTAAQTATIPTPCQTCVVDIPDNPCPAVCNDTVLGTCYGNNACTGKGQANDACLSCPACILLSKSLGRKNDGWRAPGNCVI